MRPPYSNYAGRDKFRNLKKINKKLFNKKLDIFLEKIDKKKLKVNFQIFVKDKIILKDT